MTHVLAHSQGGRYRTVTRLGMVQRSIPSIKHASSQTCAMVRRSSAPNWSSVRTPSLIIRKMIAVSKSTFASMGKSLKSFITRPS
ncbi:hypothetical protein SAMN05444161_5780 [Rhizobiales bacterium GAS191]|nr:hypothetical protein SAMN05519103_04972 [Rhizobiales bacterium GAS113]SEE12467.1 hypothetical protein SAMN05519104_5268 [Rhizobiales bacterium GAS188]SEE44426.1 hypothetical protein SAMN05444161_5780 [Rhizobiales bacterium GAS191]